MMFKLFFSVISIITIFSSACLAQQDPAIPTEAISIWDTVSKGGIIGYFIICLSLCALALIIEHFLAFRYSVLIPANEIEQLKKLTKKNDIAAAVELCELYDSFLFRIIKPGLIDIKEGLQYSVVEKTVEESARRESSRLYRKLEYLNFIAVSSPMFGILGTVTGMISAFNHIAVIDGAARSSQLASAISQALVTTCLGLIVAIPSLFFLSVFKNRIESILTDAELVLEDILKPVKFSVKRTAVKVNKDKPETDSNGK